MVFSETKTSGDALGAGLLGSITQGTVARDSDEVSKHYVLDYIRSANGLERMSSETD